MKYLFSFALVVLINAGSFSQTAEVIKYPQLEALITQKGDHIQVINFWATWCGPCIKEMPYFEALPDQINKTDLKVTFVSLDFVEKLDKVNSFIKRKKIESEVVVLDEIDYNSWIDKVDESWSGAIPATLIINTDTGERKFIEGELKEGDLEKVLEEFIN